MEAGSSTILKRPRSERQEPPYFTLVTCLASSSTLKVEATYSSGTSVDFSGLHSDVPQKIELFIPTGMRSSNPTGGYYLESLERYRRMRLRWNLKERA
jgi:hypothetical protein